MLILGAGGQAKELVEILIQMDYQDEIVLFDDVTNDENYPLILKNYTRLKSKEDLVNWFSNSNGGFLLGVGEIKPRTKLMDLGINCGGKPQTLIASNAVISILDVEIGLGTVIMQLAFISTSVRIGQGVLINARVNIHHDVQIGDNCEIGPNAILLGKSRIGANTFIGAGAIILPGVSIGENCIIGAGSIVTKSIGNSLTIKGNPAK